VAATFPIDPYLITVKQAGTLDSLIALSEELPKQDATLTITVAKTVDTLRNLLNNDPSKLAQHIQINEGSVDSYLLCGWRWNESRYGVQRGLRDMVDVLTKVPDLTLKTADSTYHSSKDMTSIDNAMKAKLINYNLVKGSLTQMQRKKQWELFVLMSSQYISIVVVRGNLSVRSLADVVSKEHVIQDSEYLETQLVAVPK
jgi:V-type H+-transporting ATPase subunit C